MHRVRRLVVSLSDVDAAKLDDLLGDEERDARALLGAHASPRPVDASGNIVGQSETVRRLIRRAWDRRARS